MPENFEAENYVIDTYQGPSLSGDVTFNLIDVLALTDGINIKVPLVTTGILAAPITTASTSCTFNALDTSAEYGTSGVWIMGDNIMNYTITTPTTATIVQNQFGTEPQDQDVSTSIQKCLAWNDTNVIDILKDLFALTEIPASYIPTVKWDELKAGELSVFNFTAVIFEPTEVKQLINELIQHCNLAMYTDVVLKEITIVASGVVANPVITFTPEEHFQEDSFSQSNLFDRLVTNQFIRWGLRNHVLTDKTNYVKNARSVSIQQEDASRLRVGTAGKDIISRWLPNTLDGNTVALQIIDRKVAEFSRIPKQVRFKTDAAYCGQLPDDMRLWLGSTFQIKLPKNCNVAADNSDVILVAQCTSIRPQNDGLVEITGISYAANIPPAFDYLIPAASYTDYVLADDPVFAPILTEGGVKEYIVIVEQGALFGSSDTAIPAFRQGTFPAGATLYLIVYGRIIGRGGDAGSGGDVEYTEGMCIPFAPSPGNDGGTALSLSTATKLDTLFGLIAGGGGGGSGLAGACPERITGNGGGGGQGNPGGLAGGPGAMGPGALGLGVSGSPGSINAPGLPTGGGLGQNGLGDAGIDGGVAGAAILTNGNTLDIISGNNSDKIKGVVI